jgi:hypothetical protein
MRPDDLLKYARNQPFQPFRLYLTDGTIHDINHPELIMVGRSTVIVGLRKPNVAIPVFDTTVELSLLHITRVENIGATPAATSN